jgi:hypothetical protein
LDIDIDTPNSFDPLKVFPKHVVRASMLKDGKLLPHPCGVYFQDIAVDPITGLAAVPYDVAEQLDCFKVDFLHLYIYDYFESKDDIRVLVKTEPDWDLLKIPSVVAQLFQLSKHYDLVDQVKPRSILELADCMALIRPQKRFMLKNYVQDPIRYRVELYRQDSNGYAFKKAHAVAYALAAVLQLHLIKAGINFS